MFGRKNYHAALAVSMLGALAVAGGFAVKRGDRLGWFRRKRTYEGDSVYILAAAQKRSRKAAIVRRNTAHGAYGLLPHPNYTPNYKVTA